MKDQLNSAIGKFSNLELKDKLKLGSLAAVAVVGVTGTLAVFNGEANYVPLGKNISQTEMTVATQLFDDSGVKYKVDSSMNLMIEESSVGEANRLLLKNGLPKGSVSGYGHLSQEQSVYTSQIKENLFNSQVLEEEIANMLSRVQGVQSAKVKLALSRETQFLREANPAKASVILTLENNYLIGRKEIAGIVNMVAASIPNLPYENVVILDNLGRTLSSGFNEVDFGSTQLDYKRRIENEIQGKITEVLAPVLGMEYFRVSVEADVDFSKQENTQEAPLPDSVLVSEQVNRDISGSSEGMGIPGSASNQPEGHTSFDDKSKSSSKTASGATGKENYTKNYEVGRSITHTQKAGNDVTKLSVAVLIDENYFTTPEERDLQVKKINDILSAVISVSNDRSDTIVVDSLPFKKMAKVVKQDKAFYEEESFINDCFNLLYAIFGVIAFWLMFFRPLVARFAPASEASETTRELTEEELLASGAFDFDSADSNSLGGSRTDDEKLRTEQNSAYLLVEKQQDLAFKIVDGWIKGVDFEMLSSSKVNEINDEKPKDLTEEEEMMMAMMNEAGMSEEELKNA